MGPQDCLRASSWRGKCVSNVSLVGDDGRRRARKHHDCDRAFCATLAPSRDQQDGYRSSRVEDRAWSPGIGDASHEAQLPRLTRDCVHWRLISRLYDENRFRRLLRPRRLGRGTTTSGSRPSDRAKPKAGGAFGVWRGSGSQCGWQ